MTPESFAKKYLTPPDAKRYLDYTKAWEDKQIVLRQYEFLIIGLNYTYKSAYTYLDTAFNWAGTPEGDRYWRVLACKLSIIRPTEE